MFKIKKIILLACLCVTSAIFARTPISHVHLVNGSGPGKVMEVSYQIMPDDGPILPVVTVVVNSGSVYDIPYEIVKGSHPRIIVVKVVETLNGSVVAQSQNDAGLTYAVFGGGEPGNNEDGEVVIMNDYGTNKVVCSLGQMGYK